MEIIRTFKIRTHRQTPAMVTKMPPEKTAVRASFLRRDIRAAHSIGIGIMSRYRSVPPLSVTMVNKLTLETAGWQTSRDVLVRTGTLTGKE